MARDCCQPGSSHTFHLCTWQPGGVPSGEVQYSADCDVTPVAHLGSLLNASWWNTRDTESKVHSAESPGYKEVISLTLSGPQPDFSGYAEHHNTTNAGI